jgi:hypothetical protein
MRRPTTSKSTLIAAAFALAASLAAPASAQSPGKVDLEAAEMAAELIGAPVFAADGPQVGEVADVSVDATGQPDRVRMTTGAALGLGARTVELPPGSYLLLRGAVVLEMPAEVVQSLPAFAPKPEEPGEEK